MNNSKQDASSAAAAERCGSPDRIAAPPAIADRLLRTYKARDTRLGNDLFQAPAWEIVLRLKTAGKGLTAGELQQLINAPLHSLQRWLEVLADRGLIVRTTGSDLGDAYALTDGARRDLADVLTSALREP